MIEPKLGLFFFCQHEGEELVLYENLVTYFVQI